MVYSSSWVAETSSLTSWAPSKLSGTKTLARGVWYGDGWAVTGAGTFGCLVVVVAPMGEKWGSDDPCDLRLCMMSSQSLNHSLWRSQKASPTLAMSASITTKASVSKEGVELLVWSVDAWNWDGFFGVQEFVVVQEGSVKMFDFCQYLIGVQCVVFGSLYPIFVDCAICYDSTGRIWGWECLGCSCLWSWITPWGTSSECLPQISKCLGVTCYNTPITSRYQVINSWQ